jgi:hypothetical protein
MAEAERPTPTAEDTGRKMTNALRMAAAASLAGGIIAASGKPHSADEAVQVMDEVRAAMKPARLRPQTG